MEHTKALNRRAAGPGARLGLALLFSIAAALAMWVALSAPMLGAAGSTAAASNAAGANGERPALALMPPSPVPDAPSTLTGTQAGVEGRVTGVQVIPVRGVPAALPSAPQSAGVKYSNIQTFEGPFAQGPASTIVSNTITRMTADNITLTEAVDGLQVTELGFVASNQNLSSVTVRPRIRFWNIDGPSGGPGTYFLNASGSPIGYTLNPIALAPGSNLVFVGLAPGFTFPAGQTRLWAGIAFDDNNGTTGVTAAQLKQVGQVAYNPPTVGSSTDVIFAGAQGDFFGVNNPSGTLYSAGGSPVENLGWVFSFSNICATAVTTTTDSGPGSLRSALACATPGDTITFSALPANSVIALTSGALTVTKPITLDGSTASNLSVSGSQFSRVFLVSAPASFVGFTVRDGDTVGYGGGLASTSPITLSAMQFVANTAAAGGGAYVVSAYVTQTTFASNQANGMQEILGEGFESGAPGWTADVSGAATGWVIGGGQHAGSLSAFAADPNNMGESGLYSPPVTPSVAGGVLRFWLNYNTETGFDGVALDIKIGGAGYSDVITAGGSFLSGGYNSTLSSIFGNPLAGRQAWTGNSGGYRLVQVSLPASATGQPVQFRWRMGSDSSTPGVGVWLDDVSLRVPTAAAFGGGLGVEGRLDLFGSRFVSNAAVTSGSGLWHWQQNDARIVNTLFARNSVVQSSGAALQFASPGSVQIVHTTIASPTVANGAGIHINQGTVSISDTIVASQTTGIFRAGGGVSEDYNLLFGDVTPRSGLGAPGAHDGSGAPKFAGPAADNYRLMVGSAAIDTGVNAGVSSDADGNPRPFGAGFDIGAYEWVLHTLYLPLVRR